MSVILFLLLGCEGNELQLACHGAGGCGAYATDCTLTSPEIAGHTSHFLTARRPADVFVAARISVEEGEVTASVKDGGVVSSATARPGAPAELRGRASVDRFHDNRSS